jgi:U32 family peptidase
LEEIKLVNLKRKDIELLAPVGSFESLQAAIQGNADSIYFGVGNLNMRSKSTLNFTTDDLKIIVEICHKQKKRAYVTLNTIMYDEDITEMFKIVDKCKELGVHAVIASDLAVLNYAKSSGIEIHISTQLNISNIESVQFFSDYADVVVLARELDLEKIRQISKSIEEKNITGPSGRLTKLELFAHGALCMAISGKCYLSLHEYNHSANKGECFQICRRSYTVTDNETQAQLMIDNEYIMSPKDVCTISFLDKILDSGIKVLKIEGRARSPEYVKTVSECYDEAIKSVCDKTFSQLKIIDWMNKLNKVYNRGFWDGYYLGRKLGEWSSAYGSVATKKKVYIGKCLNYFSKLHVAEFLIETDFVQVGDDILIIGPTSGVVEACVTEIRVNLISEGSAKKGDRFSLPIEQTIRRSDKLYKMV